MSHGKWDRHRKGLPVGQNCLGARERAFWDSSTLLHTSRGAAPCLTPGFSLPSPCPQECGSQQAVQQRALWSLELYFYLLLFNYYLHEQVGLRERLPSYPRHRDTMGRGM